MQIPQGISIDVDPKMAHTRIFTLDVPERLLTYSEYLVGVFASREARADAEPSLPGVWKPHIWPYMAIYGHTYGHIWPYRANI